MNQATPGQTVWVTTLGCKVNQFESAAFITGFQEKGCQVQDVPAKADIVVINTCAVTARAGQQSRQLVRRARKAAPTATIIVTGCYAQIAAEEILELVEGPVCVVGNSQKHLIPETASREIHHDRLLLTGDISRTREICPLVVHGFPGRTRAYLRVQDGCNNFCSYCIVPHTRGRSRSLPLRRVLHQMHLFEQAGHLEVVVTGINVGKYGLDLEEDQSIYSLLATLCTHFPGIRIRLSSVEPAEVTDELLDLVDRFPNLMPHFHIPLQSGDDTILSRMRRTYTVDHVTRIISSIRDRIPHAAIGCDILAGFPGEDARAADNTYQLLDDLPLSYLHIFPYSRRPGTPAANFADQVSAPTLQQRVQRLRKLDARKRQAFHSAHLQTRQRVLVERKNPQTGNLQGFSENYIPVEFPGPDTLIGTVASVFLVQRIAGGVIARYLDDS